MPNAKEHVIFAAGVGLVGYAAYCAFLDRKFDIGEALLATGTCVLGSLVPDAVEPALHPCHRSVAHSVGAGALSVRTMSEAWRNTKVPADLDFLLGFLLLGYVSHLVLDARTPKGLPLLC
jgi:inner membrane protein